MSRALKESDPREKIALYDRIIETHPDLASAYYNRGLVFMEQHAWQEARLDFKKYVSLKPREPSGYNNLAVSSYHLEDYENARLYWDEALRRDPGNLSYFRNKITAMIQDENYKEAIPLLKRKTGVSFPDGWILMADIYRRLGVGEQELENLARYLEIDPENRTIRYRRAELLVRLGKYREALEDYRTLFEAGYSKGRVGYKMGSLLARLGEDERALSVLEQWVRKHPDDVSAFGLLASIHLRDGRLERSLECLEKASAQDELSGEYQLSKAKILVSLGRCDEALKELDTCLAVTPDNADALELRARVLLDQGKTRESQKDLWELARQGRGLEGLESLAGFYERSGELAHADEIYSRLLEEYPPEPRWYYQRGVIRERAERPQDALADFTRVLELDPENTDALKKRAATYFLLGQYREAVSDFENLARSNPQIAEYWLKTAVAEYELGWTELSRAHYREARRCDPSLPDFHYYFSDFQYRSHSTPEKTPEIPGAKKDGKTGNPASGESEREDTL